MIRIDASSPPSLHLFPRFRFLFDFFSSSSRILELVILNSSHNFSHRNPYQMSSSHNKISPSRFDQMRYPSFTEEVHQSLLLLFFSFFSWKQDRCLCVVVVFVNQFSFFSSDNCWFIFFWPLQWCNVCVDGCRPSITCVDRIAFDCSCHYSYLLFVCERFHRLGMFDCLYLCL
jgi:hypothetical protein